MTRLLLKATFGLCILFTIPILLIQAQPYDDSELRAFLIPPDGCPAPCFMGIRPGVTTIDAAIAILESHEWVDEIHQDIPLIQYWSWSEKQSNVIDASEEGLLYLDSSREFVDSISITTKVPTGYAYLILGAPAGIWATLTSSDGEVFASAIYPDKGILISGVFYCPLSEIDLWHSTMILNVHSTSYLEQILPNNKFGQADCA